VGNLVLPSNYSAVSGACLMTRRSVFEQVGGFASSSSVGYSDVDYCLRLRELDLRIVFQPYAHLRQRAAPVTAEPFGGEALTRFTRRWSHAYGPDPYYNWNLLTENPQFAFGVD
jgi:GT2 family glycosyltransferase